MAYQCRDCSYTGAQFPRGACPACDSRNIRSTVKAPERKPQARTPFRLALMIAIWGLFLVVLHSTFFGA